jgi:hypothetical protein
VVVCAPHKHDGIADRGVDGERHVTEDTLGGCNDNRMGRTGARASHATHAGSRGGHIRSHPHGAVRGHAF